MTLSNLFTITFIVWACALDTMEAGFLNMDFLPQPPVVYDPLKAESHLNSLGLQHQQQVHLPAQAHPSRIKRQTHQVRYEHIHQDSAESLIRKPLLRPEYGSLFNHHGYMMHGLQRRYLFVAIDLPRVQDLLHDPPPAPDCLQLQQLNLPTKAPGTTPLHLEVCNSYATVYRDLMAEILKLKTNIEHKIRHEMPAMLPNKIVQTMKGPAVRINNQELWYSQYAANVTRHRRKRGIAAALPLIMSGIQTFGGMILKTVNTVVAHKRTKAMMKAMQVLQQNDQLMMDRMMLLENRTLTLARTTFQGMEKLNDRMDEYDTALDTLQDSIQEYFQEIANHDVSIRVLNKYVTTYITVLRKYHQFYLEYKTQFTLFMTALDSLSTGHLTHPLLNPVVLDRFTRSIHREIKRDHPHYQPAFDNVYQYYAGDYVTFTNTPDQLLLQIPIFFRLASQKILRVYSIETVPVPLDEATTRGTASRYTKIIPDYPFMSVNSEQYFPVTHMQLDLCHKIGLIYYCENSFLQRHRSLPSCVTTLYYNSTSESIVKQCKVTYYDSVTWEPALLDAGNQLVLSNLPQPWSLLCPPDDQPIPLPYSTYRIVNRTEFCDCSLAAGPYFIGQAALDCDGSAAQDGIFTTYYTYNQVLFDHLKVLYNISIQRAAEATNLLTAIPQVNVPVIKFKESQQNRQVLKNESKAVTCELDTLVHTMMTEDQDYYYRSSQAFEQGQHDFFTFMRQAEKWEIVHVILSFLTTLLWIGAILTCICQKKIVKAAILSLDELPDMYKVEGATLPPFTINTIPHFTLGPAPEPPKDTVSNVLMYLLYTILTIATVVMLLLCLYRRCKYRSSKWRILFPWYPRPTTRRGLFSCDIFVEVINLRTNLTTWAYFTTTTASPTQIRVIGKLKPENIAIFHACGCLRYMSVNWDSVEIFVGDNSSGLQMPRKGSLSFWTHNKLAQIDTREPHQIRLLGRVLDHIFELREIELPQILPPLQTGAATASGHAGPEPDVKIEMKRAHSVAPPPYVGF